MELLGDKGELISKYVVPLCIPVVMIGIRRFQRSQQVPDSFLIQ